VTPPRLLGRVSAINIMSYGARPVGAALGAIVGGLYGAELCLYLAVAIFGAQALVILLVARGRPGEAAGYGRRWRKGVANLLTAYNTKITAGSWPGMSRAHPRLYTKEEDVDARHGGRA